jgi:hypothetical protein
MTSVCYYIENAFKQKGMLSAHALLLPEIEGIAVIVFRDDQSEYPELWIQQSGSDNDEYVFTCHCSDLAQDAGARIRSRTH